MKTLEKTFLSLLKENAFFLVKKKKKKPRPFIFYILEVRDYTIRPLCNPGNLYKIKFYRSRYKYRHRFNQS